MPNRNLAQVKAALDELIQIEHSISTLSAQKSKFSEYRPRAAGEVASTLSALNNIIESRAALVRALVTYGNKYQYWDRTMAAQNGPYDGPSICYNFDAYLPPPPPAHEKSYLEKTLRHIGLGEFADDDDFTLLGAAGDIGLGLLGVDFPLDIRDIAGSAAKGDAGGVAFGLLMLVPVLGVLKPIRKIGKHVDEIADGLHEIGKHVDEIGGGLHGGSRYAYEIGDGLHWGGNYTDDILEGIHEGGKHSNDVIDGFKKGDDALSGKPSDALDFGDDFKRGDDMLEEVPGRKPYKPIYPRGPEIPSNLTEEYLEDLRSITEFPEDVVNIDPKGWRALDSRDNTVMHQEYNSSSKALKDEWSKRHGRPWPTYVDPKTGKIKDYELHHIRPLKFGGENVIENITPLSFEQHRMKGMHSIHRAGGPFSRMRTEYDHPKG